jgi:hypothetical protein
MRTISSAFGKLLVSVMLIAGLTATSCNQRSSDVKVKKDKNGSEDVRIKQRQNTDSVDVKHDKTIDRDKDGDVKIKENTKIDRDKNNGQGSSQSSTTTTTKTERK